MTSTESNSPRFAFQADGRVIYAAPVSTSASHRMASSGFFIPLIFTGVTILPILKLVIIVTKDPGSRLYITMHLSQ